MNWQELKAKLVQAHQGWPQREALASMALETVRAGIEELAKLGHQFHLAEGPVSTSSDKFPRHLYHPMFPGGMVVQDQAELDKQLADGWSESQSPVAPPDKSEPEASKPTAGGTLAKKLSGTGGNNA